MRISTIILLIIALFRGIDTNAQKLNKNYVDGELYVKFKSNANMRVGTASSRIDLLSQFPKLLPVFKKYAVIEARASFYFSTSESIKRVVRVSYSPKSKKDEAAFIKELSKYREIEYVEKVPLMEMDYTPNDLSVNDIAGQWSLFKVNAPAAWNDTKGNANIIVAVTDGAIDTEHEDLTGKFVAGWDVADNDNDTNPYADSIDHGTHVAGIIGAKTDNSIGMSSIGFNISIMPVKISRDDRLRINRKEINTGFEGIAWAAEHGAKIINCSWGGPGYSATNKEVVLRAYALGAIIVAAAGNDGKDEKSYPAAYEHVISVGSTDINDNVSTFSNFGSWVDVFAPGTSILSTVPGNKYELKNGTSMAAPLVAGLLGLMLSINPNLTQDELEGYLTTTAVPLKSGGGAGRIDAYEATGAVLYALPQGPCGSILGNYTVPVIYNEGFTDFFSGTITSASITLLTSETHTFKAPAIVLNPGFETLILDPGCFKAIAFNPSTCVAARTSSRDSSGKNKPPDVIKDNGNGNGIKVYPNPTNGIVNIQVVSAGETIQSIQFTDASGHVMAVKGNTKSIDVSNLARGIYFYTIQTNLRTYRGKILKQ